MTTKERTARTFDRLPATARERLREIGATAYAVLGCLCSYADSAGVCWPSISRLAQMAGMDDRTIRRSLRRLADAGIIAIERRPSDDGLHATNLYRIIYQAPTPPVRDTVTGDTHTVSDDRGRGHQCQGDTVTDDRGILSPVTPELYQLTRPLNQTSVASGKKPTDAYSPEFESFWAAYPANTDGRKPKKADAFRRWKKIPAGDHAAVIQSAATYAQSGKVHAGYVMHPTTFLSDWQAWASPPEVATPKPSIYPAAKPPREGVRSRGN